MAELALTVPAILATYEARMTFVEAAREKLRRLHNVNATAMSVPTFTAWQKDYFEPRNTAISESLLAERGSVKEAVRQKADSDPLFTAVDLGKAFTEVVAVVLADEVKQK